MLHLNYEIIYSTDTGKEPYSDWEDGLDKVTQAVVKNRLDRVRLGNFGNSKMIQDGDGIWETYPRLRSRISNLFWQTEVHYCYFINRGEKKSQNRDIKKAKQYWLDIRNYNEKKI